MPQLSDTWHSDEMMVNIKGDRKWLWNVIDEETRFMLSNIITENREIDDARSVFAEAKARARTKPDTIITDGLCSYIDAYRKEFFTLKSPRTKHIRNVGFRNKSNNNMIERLHGTIRERDKVMRALKSMETGQTIIDGLRAYYNFIRPHMTLNGKTPAQQANIDLDLGENRWCSLIRKATTR